MAFQEKITSAQALGVPGQISKGFHNYTNVTYGIVADDNVRVGYFCQSKTSATDEKEIIGTYNTQISGRVLGIVIKDKYISTCNAENTDVLRIGDNASILNVGSIFIECEAEAKKGHFVFLNNTNGALEFSEKMLKNGGTYTGFMVSIGKDAGKGIIEITSAQANTIATNADITL